MTVRVEQGDCREVIPRLVAEGVAVDAIVTDPPYGLKFMGKDWDKLDGGLPQENVWKGRRGNGGASIGEDDSGPASRHHVGFGAKRPGFKRCRICGKRAFSGSPCRCDAPEWVIEYPAGAPSSAIRMQRWYEQCFSAIHPILRPGGFLLAFGGTRTFHRMVCAIEDAGLVVQDTIAWIYGSGFPKHKSTLKPAFEPICVAYRPGGPRGLQVDECRIGTDESLNGGAYGENPHLRDEYSATDASPGAAPFSRMRRGIGDFHQPSGRWPANVIHDGGDEVEEAFAAFYDGAKSSYRPNCIGKNYSQDRIIAGGKGRPAPYNGGYPDSGTVSRFFYAAKADATDRWHSRHPTVKPVDLMRYLVALVTPPGGTVLDPFAGSGTTGAGAILCGRRAILVEAEPSYIADIHERMAALRGEATMPTPRPRRRRDPNDLLSEIEGDRT